MKYEFDSVPIPCLVLRLGIPAMFAQFFNILYSEVDRIFVGRLEGSGELALASIGVCAPILTAITAFSTLVGVGGSSAMSIFMGQKEEKQARLAMDSAFVMLLGLSLGITVLAQVFARPLLYALGCSPAMYPYASGYFRIYVSGTVAVLCGAGMNQFVLAFGNARRGMVAVILGALVNTVLDPVFIFVFGMGIQGAALATVIAQFCVLFYVLSFLFSRDPAVRRPARPVAPPQAAHGSSNPPQAACGPAFPLRLSCPPGWMVRRILSIGCLPFLIILLDNLLIISLNFVLRQYGGDALGDRYISCAAVVQSFMALVVYPAQGITTGCATLYSYHYGAGNYKKVQQVFLYVFLLCEACMLCLLLAAQGIPEVFARLFVEDAEVAALSASFIRRYTLGLLGVGVQYAIVDGLTVMGQVRFALPISLFRKGLYVTCVFLLPRFLPLEDVFYAETVSDLVGASVTLLAFFIGIRPRLQKKMEREAERRGGNR